MSVKFHGPFLPQYKLSIDGYEVPFIHAIPAGVMTNVILDERFGVLATIEEIERWLPLLANALAIGSGYSCHGQNSITLNRFNKKIFNISEIE